MKAIHKYNPRTREGARRIAQSYGYKTTIYDMPKLIALLARAGIEIQGVTLEQDTIVNNTEFTDVPQPDNNLVDTVKL